MTSEQASDCHHCEEKCYEKSPISATKLLPLRRSPDNTWTGRDTVTNTEADSGIPREFTGSGTYSINDSTLVLRSAKGTTTNFDVLNRREALRGLSTFGRVLLYTRVGSASQ